MIWTQKVQDALEKSQKDRNAEMEKKKNEIVLIMKKLTAMCLDSSVLNLQNQNRDACDNSCTPEGSV